jgi:hypothetical protein
MNLINYNDPRYNSNAKHLRNERIRMDLEELLVLMIKHGFEISFVHKDKMQPGDDMWLINKDTAGKDGYHINTVIWDCVKSNCASHKFTYAWGRGDHIMSEGREIISNRVYYDLPKDAILEVNGTPFDEYKRNGFRTLTSRSI